MERRGHNSHSVSCSFHWYHLLFWLAIIFLFRVPGEAAAFERRTPVVQAVEKAGPAVVNIRTERIVRRSSPFFGFSDPFFEEFFRELMPPRISKTESLGSGVIVDSRGYVLTNAHVVEMASKIFIALPERTKEIEGRLVGKAELMDLAVIKLEGEENYPHLKPGGDDPLLVGETVIAIGNPLGLGHSVTTGVVSAPRRRLSGEDGSLAVFIQTDALINPGNSGGPLLNINGELIGINTAIVKQAQGIGFAIPITVAKRVLDSLITSGRLSRVYAGIIPEQVGRELAAREGVGGVLATHVEKDSPAFQAGIRFGDVIRELDGVLVATPMEFFSILRTYVPGNSVRLKLLRGFETQEATLKLEKMPPNYGLRYLESLTGLAVADSGGGGVRVSKVRGDSRAAALGIEEGDFIAECDGAQIQSASALSERMESAMGRAPHRFLVVRGRRGYYVELP